MLGVVLVLEIVLAIGGGLLADGPGSLELSSVTGLLTRNASHNAAGRIGGEEMHRQRCYTKTAT